MTTPRSVSWAPSPEQQPELLPVPPRPSPPYSVAGEASSSSSSSSSSASAAAASAGSKLLLFLRSMGLAYLYPTLLHLGVHSLADLPALPDGSLEGQGVTQVSTPRLRSAGAAWDPVSASAFDWQEHASAEGYLHYVNVRAPR
jgi:hypothetical protein